MKVSSPIGELPFEPKRLRLHGTRIELDGQIGAWPAQVEMGLSDVPAIARLARKPAAVAVAAAVVVVAVARQGKQIRKRRSV